MATATNPTAPGVAVADGQSPVELRTTIEALCKEIGPKCELIAYIGTFTKQAIYASVQPKGYETGKTRESFSVEADTWADLFDRIRAEWAKRSDQSRAQTIRDMALAIIRITADLGQCTDAALRAEFDATDVARYGEDAVAQANDMSAMSPFEIVKTSGANARAA